MSDIDINNEFRTIQIRQYLISLVKLIPAEIIALYSATMAFVPQSLIGSLFVAIPLVILTPLYLIFAMRIKKTTQIVASSLAFVVWIFALGGPFIYFSWYEPWMAGTLLSLFTIVPPMLFGKQLVLNTSSNSKTTREIKPWREI